jgi:hypothetical protein
MTKLDDEPDVVGLSERLAVRAADGPVAAIVAFCNEKVDRWVTEEPGPLDIASVEALVARRLQLVVEEIWSDADFERLNRVLTYARKGEDGETSFHFRGKIITIANIVFGGNSVMDAIADRGNTTELDYTPEEMEAFLAHLACLGRDELSPDECLEVLSLITPLFVDGPRLTMRWFLNKALSAYVLSRRGIGTRVHWLDRITAEIQREKADNANPLTMDEKRRIMEEIALESYK